MQEPTPNPLLRRLDALVGEWEITPDVAEQATIRGRTTFEWLEGRFLIQRADAEFTADAPAEWVANSPFPTTSIIGLDEPNEGFSMLYTDARGVFRIYQMSLADGVWKLWREAPGFNQRFVGNLSDDGTTITGYWDMSQDGSQWQRDFDLIYSKVK